MPTLAARRCRTSSAWRHYSGSGVFAAPIAGNWNDADPRVLGPSIHGDTFLSTHLCENMNNTAASSDYVNVEHTQKIEALVLGDR